MGLQVLAVLQLGTHGGSSDSTASREQVVDVLVRDTQTLLCGGAEGPPAGKALQPHSPSGAGSRFGV